MKNLLIIFSRIVIFFFDGRSFSIALIAFRWNCLSCCVEHAMLFPGLDKKLRYALKKKKSHQSVWLRLSSKVEVELISSITFLTRSSDVDWKQLLLLLQWW